jgi:hypothetical protein
MLVIIEQSVTLNSRSKRAVTYIVTLQFHNKVTNTNKNTYLRFSFDVADLQFSSEIVANDFIDFSVPLAPSCDPVELSRRCWFSVIDHEVSQRTPLNRLTNCSPTTFVATAWPQFVDRRLSPQKFSCHLVALSRCCQCLIRRSSWCLSVLRRIDSLITRRQHSISSGWLPLAANRFPESSFRPTSINIAATMSHPARPPRPQFPPTWRGPSREGRRCSP